MKKGLTFVTAMLMTCILYAQEYKVAKNTGRLEISEVNHVTIEGHSGNEIIFSVRNQNRDDDGRAKGLRAISSLGLEDNTGLGLSVLDKNGVIEVAQLKKTDGPEVKILVPKGVIVSYAHSSPHGDQIEIKNFDGEVEVSTVHNGVILSNVNGPLNIKTVHGDIEATLGASLKSPINITSVHAHVDVAMPVGTKANLQLGTTFGEIFVDPDFKIDIDNTGGMKKYSGALTGKINGGGIDIHLSSTHNNVYLRKK